MSSKFNFKSIKTDINSRRVFKKTLNSESLSMENLKPETSI